MKKPYIDVKQRSFTDKKTGEVVTYNALVLLIPLPDGRNREVPLKAVSKYDRYVLKDAINNQLITDRKE